MQTTRFEVIYKHATSLPFFFFKLQMICDLGSIICISKKHLCSLSFIMRKFSVINDEALNKIKIKGLFISYSSPVSL